MTAAVVLLLIGLSAGALYFALAPLVRAWRKARVSRLAPSGPEAQEPAAAAAEIEKETEIDPVDAAFQALLRSMTVEREPNKP